MGIKEATHGISIIHEAEYRVLAITAAELAWIRQLFCDMHIPLYSSPMIYCDNVSAIALSINHVFHAKSKHIEIDYHFVREIDYL